jgi:murein DD-endopeptidase MepM/ murein hydrolase activator NlpD
MLLKTLQISPLATDELRAILHTITGQVPMERRSLRVVLQQCSSFLPRMVGSITLLTAHSKKQLVTFINTSHFLTVGVSATLILAFFFYTLDGYLLPQTEETVAAAPAQEEEFAPESAYTEIAGEIRPGDSLNSSFRAYGISEEVRQTVVSAFGDILNFRNLRPRDRYLLTLDEEGGLVRCVYESGPLDIRAVERTADGSYRAERLAVPLSCQTVKVAGVVQSSLFASFQAFDETPKLIYSFADIFASRIDFNTEIRSGDEFELVFEKYYKDEEFVGYGNILMARYDSQARGRLEAFYFAAEDSRAASYFDREGQELGASFIRSPVPMARLTSGFSKSRLHPVLNVRRPHLGVDLAAPTGTPIMAAADGRVHFVGWNGGYGKQIILEHGGGYRTYYGHLSRFADTLKVGSRVSKKQVIGYVGSTGLSSGPHLDYRLSQNGTFINPFSLKFTPRSVLSGAQLAQFRQEVQGIIQQADNLDNPGIIRVRSLVVTPESQVTFL